MADPSYDAVLLIDDDFEPPITIEEAEALKPIQKKFLASYFANRDKIPLEDWLNMEMAKQLPSYDAKQIGEMSHEIIETLRLQEEKKASLDKAVANGRSKESWFAGEMKKLVSLTGTQQASHYLQNLDNAVSEANAALARTIHTQSGAISMNPRLDGFIAEQYHAQTFNLNAEATGSPYRARVLEPNGTGYAKNSVDVVIEDASGRVVRRYQSKYCKDAQATAKAFEGGDYRGQRKLVPDGQQDAFAKASNKLEAPDGTSSTPLTKEGAKQLQEEAQSGKWQDLNWNEYKTADVAIGIGKQAGQAALMGAAIGVGMDVAQKVWNGEEIEAKELAKTAVESGADLGVKAALSGAIKVGAEKGILRMIPKGTPAATIANVVHVGVENVKVITRIAKGELTPEEGLDKMAQVTVSTVAGIAAGAKGAAIGASIGTVLGPVGVAVGGFVGGTIGYMAGSAVGNVVVKTAQAVGKKAKEIVSNIVGRIRDRVSSGLRQLRGLFA